MTSADPGCCASDADCSGGLTCDETGTCAPCADNDCTIDYPVCVDIGGDNYCIQCSEDSHCKDGCTCDTALYACSGDCVNDGAEQCGDGAGGE